MGNRTAVGHTVFGNRGISAEFRVGNFADRTGIQNRTAESIAAGNACFVVHKSRIRNMPDRRSIVGQDPIKIGNIQIFEIDFRAPTDNKSAEPAAGQHFRIAVNRKGAGICRR